MSTAWYVDRPDRPLGPLSDEELRALARAGDLHPADRVSTDRRHWRPAATVPDLVFPPAAATQPDLSAVDSASATLPYRSGPKPSAPGPQAIAVPGYEVLGELGAGAMGVVYRARQTALGRVVALKTVQVGRQDPAAAVARFEQEARAVARLRHP